jgi:hypothetical protein
MLVTFVTRLNRLMPLLESARMDATVKQQLPRQAIRVRSGLATGGRLAQTGS